MDYLSEEGRNRLNEAILWMNMENILEEEP